MIDVNALIGAYPFRPVPHPDPEMLVRVLDREEARSRLGRPPCRPRFIATRRRATPSCLRR